MANIFRDVDDFKEFFNKLDQEHKKQLLKTVGMHPEPPDIFKFIEEEKVYTVRDVADLLGYTVQHVRRLCKQGKIPAFQHMSRGKYLIFGQQIKEFYLTYFYRDAFANRLLKN